MTNRIEITKNTFLNTNEPLEIWIRQIRKYKVLTVSEEEEVISRYMDGDERALDTLIQCNQRFLLSAAKTYSKNPDEILDLIAEGNIALLEAIKDYDLTIGTRFLSYAVFHIKRRMNAYLTNRKLVRHSVIPKYYSYLKKVKKEWMSEYNTEMPESVAYEKMCQHFGKKFHANGVAYKTPETVYDEDISDKETDPNSVLEKETCVLNNIVEQIEREDLQHMVGNLIEHTCLSENERYIMVHTYGLFGEPVMGYEEIGNRLGLKPKQVGYITLRTLNRMKRYLNGEKIKTTNKSKFQPYVEQPPKEKKKRGRPRLHPIEEKKKKKEPKPKTKYPWLKEKK